MKTHRDAIGNVLNIGDYISVTFGSLDLMRVIAFELSKDEKDCVVTRGVTQSSKNLQRKLLTGSIIKIDVCPYFLIDGVYNFRKALKVIDELGLPEDWKKWSIDDIILFRLTYS